MGRRFALIIGSSEYEDAGLAQLKAPDADVTALDEVLRSVEIGGFDEVKTLVNEPFAAIYPEIAHFFAGKKRDDLLLLYFSGHGVLDDQGRLYLALKNTRRELLRGTAIPATFVSDEMDGSNSRRQVLVLDCCHSGAFARGTKGVVGASVGTAATFAGTGYGRVVLTATDATQYAWEGDQVIGQAQKSVFTRYLIQGLQTGEADADRDGKVTLDELYDYVYAHVVNETPRQTPGKWTFKEQGEIIIARNPITKAAELSAELQQSIEDPRPWVREGVVRELDQLLRGGHAGLALAAYEALTKLAEDDSLRVSTAASKSLEAHAVAQRLQERARQAQEEAEAERQAREKAEQERLARQKAERERLADEEAEAGLDDLAGKQLGPYRVAALLGQGGMAAVYKAYQPGMDRFVALKVLPRQLAGDPEFSGRFKQEAKVIAKLQHPHILPVYDFGEAGGYTYLVMPLVEAGTLANLVREHTLPLQQIRSIISQVGDALDYAHSRGLVHRDVKPSNVLIDERGNCLLADFGIAKIVEGTAKFTASGGILGTPAYMSPEQGKGLPADRRSDIYSLGVILYELATGRVPFEAETPIAVMIKHINDPLPPPRTLNPALPEAVEQVILKSLAKHPDERFATAAEMVGALQAAIPERTIVTAPGEAAAPVSPPIVEQHLGRAAPIATPAEWYRRIPAWGWILGSTVAVSVLAGLFAIASGTVNGSATPESSATQTAAAIAVLPTDTSQPNATPTVTVPPTATPTLRPTLIGGGTERIAFDSQRDGNGEIYVMNINGTELTNLTNNPAGDFDPDWSPDGRRIVFGSNRDGNGEIYVMNADGSGQVNLTNSSANESGAVWSPDSTRVLFVSDRDGNREIYVMNADGSGQTRLTDNPADEFDSDWSPDSRRIIFVSNHDGNFEIYVMNADGSGQIRLTDTSADEFDPDWSPDGAQIAFASNRDGNFEIYVTNADGSEPSRLTVNSTSDHRPAWSPDGMRIAFDSERDGNGEIYIMNADGSDQTNLTHDPARDFRSAWQP